MDEVDGWRGDRLASAGLQLREGSEDSGKGGEGWGVEKRKCTTRRVRALTRSEMVFTYDRRL